MVMTNTLADFPEPPAGMKMRVLRSPTGVLLTGYHTVSSGSHYIQKAGLLLLGAPFCFALGVRSLFALCQLVLSHESVDTQGVLPQGVAVAFTVLMLVVGVLLGVGISWHILKYAIGLTPDRPNWELKISPNKWHSTVYQKVISDSDPSAVRRDLEPSQIQTIGVGRLGEVYAEEVADSQRKVKGKGNDVSSRVDLTTALPPNEAAWLQHQLGLLLDLAPSSPNPSE